MPATSTRTPRRAPARATARRGRTSTVAGRAAPQRAAAREPALPVWLRAQGLNVTRHAAGLRPFHRGEFGAGAAAPTPGHLQAVNQLLTDLRRGLLRDAATVTAATRRAQRQPTRRELRRVAILKERAHDRVRHVERVWDFYFELFGQRQSQYADMLLACDRIALDCYQTAFIGNGVARSVPAPAPFSYMRTGFSPATFRRGLRLAQLGREANPFPLIQLPYHRLLNPWTLGAVLHEVCHNLQNDLHLHVAVPREIAAELRRRGLPDAVVRTWVRWNRETFADLAGLLLGGPGVVGSLMDVVGRGPRTVVAFSPRGPHPTPYLRVPLSLELLRRMGFPDRAAAYGRAWSRMYERETPGTIPRAVLSTSNQAIRSVVDVVCFRAYPQLGGRSLAQVLEFGPKEQELVEEAAARLAAGNDPGVVPERFLIGAARVAMDRRMARPQVITDHFYRDLARR